MSWIVPQAPCWVQMTSTKYDKENANEEPLFLEATVLSQTNSITIQLILNQEKRTVNELDLYIRHFDPAQIVTFQDMVKMPILNEPEILNNIFVRFRREEIYSYIGPTLLCMNPYKQVKLFDSSVISKVQKAVLQSPIFELNLLEPHIYAVSGLAFRNMINGDKKQAIVISGESGAGKTENAKYAMKLLTSLSEARKTFSKNRRNAVQLQEALDREAPIEDRILACNPILEAFGNAKTVRNDNSSRFGKYVRIQVEGNRIVGANIKNYLLEKSRVISQGMGERNYHIFYLMLNGLPPGELTGMGLIKTPIDKPNLVDFPYLQESETSPAFFKMFDEMKESFESTGFQNYEIRSVYSVLAAILHLGAVKFDDSKYDENSSPCQIKNHVKIAMVAQLLSIPVDLLSKSLTLKIRVTPMNSIESPIKLTECEAKRDAFAKFLYDKLFSWLVFKLNLSINSKQSSKSIGLLDIFGFENFQINSFEQLCINYTNERLQQLYINYIFKREQLDFIEDGLDEYLSILSFTDNQQIVTLLDGQMSVFSLLDEECMLKNGSDDSFLGKAQKAHQKHPNFISQQNKRTFTISHTQSQVVYQATGLIAKNRDEANVQLEEAMSSSTNEIISIIYAKSSIKNQKTLGANFRKEMFELMNELESSQVHFVRCIKPNEKKQRDNFIWSYVFQQIKYLGVLDSINIRKQTYPYRYEYVQFYSNYRDVEPNLARKFGSVEQLKLKKADFRNMVQSLLTCIFPEQDSTLLLYGQRKVYLKKEYMSILDARLMERFKVKVKAGLIIMRAYRIYKFRKSIKINLKQLIKALRIFRKLLRRRYIKLLKIKLERLFKSIQKSKCSTMKLHFKRIIVIAYKKKKQQQLNNKRSSAFDKAVKKLQVWFLKQGYYILKSANEFHKFKLTLNSGEYEEEQISEKTNEIKPLLPLENHIVKKPPQSQNDPNQIIETKQVVQQNKSQIRPESKQKKRQKSEGKKKKNDPSKLPEPIREITDEDIFSTLEEEVRRNNYVEYEPNHPQPVQHAAFYTPVQNYQTQNPALGYESSKVDFQTLGIRDFNYKLPDQFSLPYQEPLMNRAQFFNIALKAITNKTTHGESAPFSCDRTYVADRSQLSFIAQLHQFDIVEWAQKHIKPRKTFFGFQQSVDQILSYQSGSLKQSLLNFENIYEEKRAMDLFKKIQILMRETFTIKQSNLLIDLIRECLTSQQDFIDEIYLQMMKQIRGNGRSLYVARLCQLMAVLSYFVLPSNSLCMCILNFLRTKETQNKYQEEISFFRYAFARILRHLISPHKLCKFVPPNYQIIAVLTQRQIWIPVFICTGGTVIVPAESFETIEHIKAKVLSIIGVNIKRVPLNFFGFCEILNKANELHERLVDGNTLVWQLLARWEEEKLIGKRNNSQIIYILMLKIIYAYDHEPLDFLTKQLVFSQTFYDLFTGRFQPTTQHIDQIVYILNNTKGLTLNVTQCLPFLPKNDFNSRFVQYKESQKEEQSHIKLEDSQSQFLEIARTYPQFLCIYIRIKYCINKKFLNNDVIYLGLKPFRIFILSDSQSHPIAKYDYNQIQRWGTSEKSIVFHTTDGNFHLCETQQAAQVSKYITDCATIYKKLDTIKTKMESTYTSTDLQINPRSVMHYYQTGRSEGSGRNELLETEADSNTQSLIPQDIEQNF